jgi:hypothetical protein
LTQTSHTSTMAAMVQLTSRCPVSQASCWKPVVHTSSKQSIYQPSQDDDSLVYVKSQANSRSRTKHTLAVNIYCR